jgi:ATPase subunit of ABC transporter with duplicated ATPase domains
MSLRNVLFVVCALAGLTATLAAQQAAPLSRKAAPKVHANLITITGCVAQGADADHYVLENAVRRKDPPSSAAIAGASKEVGSDKAEADDRIGPYDLQGAEFKAHLGHRVEVIGTGGSGKTTDTKAKLGAAEAKELPSFNVQSVKMVSATCS